MIPYKCLKVSDGVIVLLEASKVIPSNRDISIFVSDAGVVAQIDTMKIPIPDQILDHMTDNPYVTVYFTNEDRFVEDSYITVELDKKTLLEAKGAWEFKKRMEREKKKLDA